MTMFSKFTPTAHHKGSAHFQWDGVQAGKNLEMPKCKLGKSTPRKQPRLADWKKSGGLHYSESEAALGN